MISNSTIGPSELGFHSECDCAEGPTVVADLPGMISPETSVIVPVLNEAENLSSLIHRLSVALAGKSHEVIIVDDLSVDNTREVCCGLAREFPLSLFIRQMPVGGLSGAVLFGCTKARGRFLVVMDADLQHPPEQIRAVLDPLVDGRADMVIGSRYVNGGRIAGRWGLARRLTSRIAVLLAAPLTGAINDPMSGYFAIRRESVVAALQSLNPLGYKIALELICKCKLRSISEVPIEFAIRTKGHSKLGAAQEVAYLRHLLRLYACVYPRLSAVCVTIIYTMAMTLASSIILRSLFMAVARLEVALPASYTSVIMLSEAVQGLRAKVSRGVPLLISHGVRVPCYMGCGWILAAATLLHGKVLVSELMAGITLAIGSLYYIAGYIRRKESRREN